MSWKLKFFATILGALVMFGGAGAAQAADRDDACYRKIRNEERELDRAINRHGYHSRQADHERRELDKLRDKCSYRYDRR